jgi:MFS family permease
MGLLGTVSAAGTALGPSLGGMLVGACGWQSVFVLQAVLGLPALLSVCLFLPANDAKPARPRFDHQGTLLLALMLTAYALALTPGAGPRLLFLLLAVGGALLFVRIERRSRAPLVDLGLFRDRVLTAGFAASLVATAVVMATLVVGPFYLSGALGLDAGRMGLTMAAGPVIAAIAGWPAGRIADRYGASAGTLAGLAGMGVGACLLWAAPPASASAYALCLALLTAGYALFQAANNTAVMSGVEAARRGLVSGLLGLARNLGLVSGAALMGAVFMHVAGNSAVPGPAAVTEGFQACFGLASLLLGLVILVQASLVRRTAVSAPDTLPR